MRRGLALALVGCLWGAPAAARQGEADATRPFQVAAEVIAEIQVHGNNVTPDAEILAIAGVVRGHAFASTTLEEVRQRLVASGRFEGVRVLKRFASVSDPLQISLVIILDERPVAIAPGIDPGEAVRIRRRPFGRGPLFLPILDVEDGYGVTYGATIAVPHVAGERSRLLFPLSWGGRRRAATEFDAPIASGAIGRVRAGGGIDERRHPAYLERETRVSAWSRVETRTVWHVRAGVTGRVDRIAFGGAHDVWRSVGADVTLDTRRDPVFPRDAIFVHASGTHVRGDEGRVLNRRRLDARGYVGLIGSPVIAVHVEQDAAAGPLPDYFKPILGGWSSLRGFRAGSFVGDNRLVTSLELRVPVSSPLSIVKAGISVFADAGKSYDHGVPFDAAPWHAGTGAGVWVAATVVKAGVSIARGAGGDTRINVGIGVEY